MPNTTAANPADAVREALDHHVKVLRGMLQSGMHHSDGERALAAAIAALSAADLRRFRGVAIAAMDYALIVNNPVDLDQAQELLRIIDGKTCRFCGWNGIPETAADPYTTDGTVEVCGGCNNAESFV